MTTYLSANFDADTIGSAPSGWSQAFIGWSVQTAPGGMSGRVLQSSNQASDNYVYKSMTRQTSGQHHVSVQFKTQSSLTGGVRSLQVRDCDGSYASPKHAVLVYNGTIYGVDGNTNVGFSALLPDTVYTLEWWIDIATNKVLAYQLDGTTTKNNGGAGWSLAAFNTSLSGLDTIAFNNYSGATQTYWHDVVTVDDSTAPTITSTKTGAGVSAFTASGPSATVVGKTGIAIADFVASGSKTPYRKTGAGVSAATASGASAVTLAPPAAPDVYASGTHGGVACGPSLHAHSVLAVYSPRATSLVVEDSIDSGGSWTTITSVCQITNLGGGWWRVVHLRPTYSTGSAALGTTFQYRVKGVSGAGTGSASTPVSVTPALDRDAIWNTRLARHNAALVASGLNYIPSGNGVNVYPGESLLAWAWGYWRSCRDGSPNATYKTNALNQLTYVQTLMDAHDVLHFPYYSTQTYIDHHGRTAYHIAAAARLFRVAGDGTTAATFVAVADRLAKAIFDQLDGGNPTYSYAWPTYLISDKPAYQTNHDYAIGAVVSFGGKTHRALNAGRSSSVAPGFSTSVGSECVDNAGTGHSSTPITWRETRYTGVVFKHVFSASSPYTFTGTTGQADFDTNQISEQCGLLALLCADYASAFYPAGTYRTKALDAIVGCVGAITVYSGPNGEVPIGYDDAFAATYYEYDTLYGGFTIETFSVIRHVLGSQHPAMDAFLAAGVNWLTSGSLANEPLTATYWATGATVPSFFQLATRNTGSQVAFGTQAVTEPLLYQGCYFTFDTYLPTQGYLSTGQTTSSDADLKSLDYIEPVALMDAVLKVEWVKSGQATSAATASGVEAYPRPKTGAAVSAFTASGASSHTTPSSIVKTGAAVSTCTASGAKTQTSTGGTTSTKTGAGVSAFTASGRSVHVLAGGVAATHTLPASANFVSARSQTANFVSPRSQTADFVAGAT